MKEGMRDNIFWLSGWSNYHYLDTHPWWIRSPSENVTVQIQSYRSSQDELDHYELNELSKIGNCEYLF